jgi:hypothetical protein
MKEIDMKLFAINLLLSLYLGISFSSAGAQTHFKPVGSTAESYSIVITTAVINSASLEANDEIGVFTSAGLCVGAVQLQSPPFTNIPLAAWKDNPQTSQTDGYTAGDTMRFKIWDSSVQREFSVTKPVYQIGDGTFEYGIYAILSLAITTGVKHTVTTELPADFVLRQNYPNPLRPAATTTIHFELPRKARVSLQIFNVLGQSVRRLLDASMPAGAHPILWDGRDDAGKQVIAGLYFYRLTTENVNVTRKLVVAE